MTARIFNALVSTVIGTAISAKVLAVIGTDPVEYVHDHPFEIATAFGFAILACIFVLGWLDD